jgi:hypothetical protein
VTVVVGGFFFWVRLFGAWIDDWWRSLVVRKWMVTSGNH